MNTAKLLLTWDQYRKKDFTVPYIFRVEQKKQYLLYFGAAHVFDPADEQFQTIKSCWEEFLEKTNRQNCLVLVEGAKRDISKDMERDIRHGGEGDFITHLATASGIGTECPEPSRITVLEKLLKDFPKEEVSYAHFALIVLQWHKLNPRPNFDEYISHFLDRDREQLGWKDFDFSLDHMKAIHKRLFQKGFSLPNEKFFYSIVAPPENTAITNKISRVEDLVRDGHIVDEIVRYWNKGKNLFIVFGVGHAVVQEPALKKLLG